MTYPAAVIQNTLVDYPRLDVIVRELRATNGLEGGVAEVGVYKGGTAALICLNTSKDVLLFDTFEGMPKVRADVDLHREGDFADTSELAVVKLIASVPFTAGGPFTYKGLFPQQTSQYILESEKFAFVHLDVDIYDSVKDCLEFFVPRMVPGGVIILDDYLEPNCPGAKLAADEFCIKNGNVQIELTCQSQALIRF